MLSEREYSNYFEVSWSQKLRHRGSIGPKGLWLILLQGNKIGHAHPAFALYQAVIRKLEQKVLISALSAAFWPGGLTRHEGHELLP
jgi:hypothetical protein